MKFEDEFDVVPPEGNVFVNHEINGRSGHLGHALVEYEEGKILIFWRSGISLPVKDSLASTCQLFRHKTQFKKRSQPHLLIGIHYSIQIRFLQTVPSA